MKRKTRNRSLRRRYGRASKKLTPIAKIPAFAVIIRAVHTRGVAQAEAKKELSRRGLYLSSDQERQSKLTPAQLDRELLGRKR